MADSIHSYANGSMAIGFTEWQFESLRALLLNRSLPAPPPSALQLYSSPSEPPHLLPTSVPSELPLQPIPAPISALSYPPSPCVEAIEEVEHKQIPLRNIGPMKKKLGASKKVPTSRLPSVGNYIEWPTTFGESNMLFSRDEDLDAWYTTMLNHTQKLAIY